MVSSWILRSAYFPNALAYEIALAITPVSWGLISWTDSLSVVTGFDADLLLKTKKIIAATAKRATSTQIHGCIRSFSIYLLDLLRNMQNILCNRSIAQDYSRSLCLESVPH